MKMGGSSVTRGVKWHRRSKDTHPKKKEQVLAMSDDPKEHVQEALKMKE